VDYYWNFENDCPIHEKYSLIISQAMLEHLINPYKHISDLANLLENGGHLIVHSVLPLYQYHRYPIDCLRFFPDWFEEVAKRLELEIVDKYIRLSHITYKYKKR